MNDSNFKRFAKKNVTLFKVDFAEAYRLGKDTNQRRDIVKRIFEERAAPRFIEVSGWPHIAIIPHEPKKMS